MTDQTPHETTPSEVSSSAVRDAQHEFQVLIHLHLPDVAATRVSHGVLAVDKDYDAEKLAQWAGAQFAQALADVRAEAAAEARAVEASTARVIEAAGAGGTLTASLEFGRYLAQLEQALKSNLSLSDQWDLGRTVGVQRERLVALASQLIAHFPFLAAAIQPDAQTEGLALLTDQP